MDVRVANGKYKLSRRIGGGSFGEVFKAVDIETKEVVAVKLEPRKCKVPQLVFEARLLKYLQHGTVTCGFPSMRWHGQEGEYNIMVVDMLGPSLEKLFSFCGKKFSAKTTLMVALQLVCRLEFLHTKSFIHRDIKPENFVMGTGKRGHHVYMIDFGLSKKFRDPKTKQHIPYKEGKSLTGTARYVSTFTHLGIEQSRRDDMESTAYMLIYFARGSLPWQGFKATDKQEKYEKIAEKKMSLTPEALCKFLPTSLLQFLQYSKGLKFDEEPTYGNCRQWFYDGLADEQSTLDYGFDWLRQGQDSDKKSTASSQMSMGLNSSRNVNASLDDLNSSGGGSDLDDLP